MDAIRQCYAPGFPTNFFNPGLIYDVASDEAGNVTVKMTLTTPDCPSAQAIPEQVRSRVAAVEKVNDVKVDIVWEPSWNPSMISASGKAALGLEVKGLDAEKTGGVIGPPISNPLSDFKRFVGRYVFLFLNQSAFTGV